MRRTRLPRWAVILLCITALFATLIVCVYIVENGRGRQAWEKYVADMAAKGERLDKESVIPPPIPDDENFAMAPVWLPLYKPERGGVVDPADKEAVRQMRLPVAYYGSWTGNWSSGRMADFTQLAKKLAEAKRSKDVSETPAADLLAETQKFEPTLTKIKEAAARPKSRLPIDYSVKDASTLQLYGLTSTINVCQIVGLRAKAELALKQTDAAFDDVLLAFRIAETSSSEPLLIAHLVTLTELSNAMNALWEGLVRHEWNDEQLAQFQEVIARQNLVAGLQTSVRCERNLFQPSLRDPKALRAMIKSGMGPSAPKRGVLLLQVIPSGWIDQNAVTAARWQQQIIDGIDAPSRRIDPKPAREIVATLSLPYAYNHPYWFLGRYTFSSISGNLEKSAMMQSSLNLALIAIALERHALRHGNVLPSTLNEIDSEVRGPESEWRVDPANGHSVHYELRGGSFLLYYDGWDGIDEGGLINWPNGDHDRDPLLDRRLGLAADSIEIASEVSVVVNGRA